MSVIPMCNHKEPDPGKTEVRFDVDTVIEWDMIGEDISSWAALLLVNVENEF